MPRLIPKSSRWTDDEIVICWATFTTGEYVIRRGMRIRGSHPAVKACPAFFVADGTADYELPNEFSLVEPPVVCDDPLAVYIPPSVPLEDSVICHTGFYVMATGRMIDKGASLHKDDAVVEAHPEYFHTAPRPLSG